MNEKRYFCELLRDNRENNRLRWTLVVVFYATARRDCIVIRSTGEQLIRRNSETNNPVESLRRYKALNPSQSSETLYTLDNRIHNYREKFVGRF